MILKCSKTTQISYSFRVKDNSRTETIEFNGISKISSLSETVLEDADEDELRKEEKRGWQLCKSSAGTGLERVDGDHHSIDNIKLQLFACTDEHCVLHTTE